MAVDYVKEGRIAIMTINRPEARNALNADAHRELAEAMIDFRDNSELWVAIITGAGDIFQNEKLGCGFERGIGCPILKRGWILYERKKCFNATE